MACDAGILPPGPRNFPSIRFLRVSECVIIAKGQVAVTEAKMEREYQKPYDEGGIYATSRFCEALPAKV
jgi:hypothetical protein